MSNRHEAESVTRTTEARGKIGNPSRAEFISRALSDFGQEIESSGSCHIFVSKQLGNCSCRRAQYCQGSSRGRLYKSQSLIHQSF